MSIPTKFNLFLVNFSWFTFHLFLILKTRKKNKELLQNWTEIKIELSLMESIAPLNKLFI